MIQCLKTRSVGGVDTTVITTSLSFIAHFRVYVGGTKSAKFAARRMCRRAPQCTNHAHNTNTHAHAADTHTHRACYQLVSVAWHPLQTAAGHEFWCRGHDIWYFAMHGLCSRAHTKPHGRVCVTQREFGVRSQTLNDSLYASAHTHVHRYTVSPHPHTHTRTLI